MFETLQVSAASVIFAVSVLSSSASAAAADSAPAGWDLVPQILKRIVPPAFPDKDFKVTDFGAKGDGTNDCCKAFSDAIAACNKAGGGRVVVPAGTYKLDGPIHLLSNVNLHLVNGATLDFTADPKFYLPVVLVKWEGTRCYNYSPLIYAYQQQNIALTGAGVINGSYSNFWHQWNFKVEKPDQMLLQKMGQELVPVEKRVFGEGHLLRPYGIQFYECKNILIDGITIKESPMWSLSPVFCSNVTIRGFKVLPGYYNDDGCDPDSCTDVLIENCDFATSDDNIAIKAGRDNDAWAENGGRPCENLIIRNNFFRWSRNNAIAIGSEMSGGVRNVFVENNRFGQIPKYVIYFKSNTDRGGAIENVWMRNNTGAETSPRTVFRFEANFNGVTTNSHPPTFRNFRFENFKFGPAKTNGIAIQGLPQKHITDVFFKDITIESAPVPKDIGFADEIFFENVKVGGQLVEEP